MVSLVVEKTIYLNEGAKLHIRKAYRSKHVLLILDENGEVNTKTEIKIGDVEAKRLAHWILALYENDDVADGDSSGND